MREDLIPTGILLKELNCSSVESLSDRIVLQKKIFLTQYLGLKLGYAYGWYLHGPYCTDLASRAYEIERVGVDDLPSYRLPQRIRTLVDVVNGLESNPELQAYKLSERYELLASVAYWRNKGFANNEIAEKITFYKPQFSVEDVFVGLRCVESLDVYRLTA
ncbi:MAG: hypothetical protein VB025_00195 [Sphaerochaeta sp.]|nr:hypothetical protein [Sphaerochaeta sp.]